MSDPLADLITQLVADARAAHPERPALIGVGGAQGSGKSFQCAAFAKAHPGVAHFSLDDVYLTRAEREQLAEALHPLFVTRGPPGTHDLSLARGVIARLGSPLVTELPRFEKAADDRAPEITWPTFQGPAETILVDGWCMGAVAPAMSPAFNEVERADDEGAWREASAAFLDTDYTPFFDAFDAIVYLQAPSFEIVRRWRGEQEEKMLGRAMTESERAALDRFIMHYERLTRSMLAGFHRAGWVVHLDEARNVVRLEER
ncbi:D-glycerate 3-kinase, plant type [alpha proteobacterium U9-1i]|nr:D-glycerate 3-kinase, plant type [alpha proteobacterium U9-1i]